MTVKSRAYLAFVRPIVEYASVIWNPYTNCDKVTLEGVQRKAARYVRNDFSCYSSVISMNNLQWISLEDGRTQSRLIIFYKIIHDVVKVNFNSYLHPSGTIAHDQQLRCRQLHARINSYHHSFLPASIRDWNSLSTEVVTSSSLDDFILNLSNLYMHTHSCLSSVHNK